MAFETMIGKRILILENEKAGYSPLKNLLHRDGHDFEFAFDGSAALERIDADSFDLIILDVNLPGQSGLDLCLSVRERGIETPILFLTAKTRPIDRVMALRVGGDDCLSKPCDCLELMARVEALLRRPRCRHVKATMEYVQFDSFNLDLRKGQISQNGSIVHLTTKESHLLRYFAENPGVPIPRHELLSRVWDLGPETKTRTVDVHVASLRQKLEQDPKNPQIIQTVHHLGYRFSARLR